MPKEVIHTDDDFVASVGWSGRDNAGTLQLGVGLVDGRSLFWQLASIPNGPTSDVVDDALWQLGDRIARTFPGLDAQLCAGYNDVSPEKRRAARIEWASAMLNLLDTAGDTPADSPRESSGYSAVWATLDRDAVNRLIRVLRRARDQAYGRDE